MLHLDHLAVTAQTLAEGVDAVENALGVAMVPGGKHSHMSTHNCLLGLGDVYLEAIAIDPAAPPPGRPRWFGLDHFKGAARLNFWVANCDDIDTALAGAPAGFGAAIALERGDFRWKMAASADGSTPFDGGFPALIQWQGSLHPTQRLPESNVRLTRLEIAHPRADGLSRALAPLLQDRRVIVTAGPAKALRATFTTPHGPRFIE